MSKDKRVQVPMMTLAWKPLTSGTVSWAARWWSSCTPAMTAPLFILPDEGKMQDLEAKLIPETLKRWRNSLQPR